MVPSEEAKMTKRSLYASFPGRSAVAVMVAMGVRPCAFHCGAGPRNPLGDAQPAQALMLRPGVLMRLWATGLKSKVARTPGVPGVCEFMRRNMKPAEILRRRKTPSH